LNININNQWIKFFNSRISKNNIIDYYEYDKNFKLSSKKELKLLIIKNKKITFNQTNIILYPYSFGIPYTANFLDLNIYLFYLVKYYKHIFIPLLNFNIMDIDNMYLDFASLFDNDIYNFKSIFPWIILYHSNDKYYIHSYLNYIINNQTIKLKNSSEVECLTPVFLVIITNSNSFHANVLIYNFKYKTIERFDPYGNVNIYGNGDIDIDNVLCDELTWNTEFEYIKPSCYLPDISFQTISNETFIKNQKIGDINGFCLVWCMWFIEMKLLNMSLNTQLLIKNMLYILDNLKIKFSVYIRNYADFLTQIKILLLVNNKFPYEYINSKIKISDDILYKYYKYIHKKINNLNTLNYKHTITNSHTAC